MDGVLFGDYQLLQRIGHAHFGPVFKARHRHTGALRALKLFCKEKMNAVQLSGFREEAELARSIIHENVLRTYAQAENEQFLYLESEYLPGGELFQIISKEDFFLEDKARDVLNRVIEAIAHLHSKGIAHRDVKPENIVLARKNDLNSLKLIDFGSARRFSSDTRFADFYGTSYYMAPEIFARNGSEKVDLWACGVIAYVMLCGVPPFNGENTQEIGRRLEKGPPSFAESAWNFVSPSARSFVECLLTAAPALRPSATEALQHPWLTCTSDTPQAAGRAEISPKLGHFCALTRLQRILKLFVLRKREMEEARCGQSSEESPHEHESLAGRRKVVASRHPAREETKQTAASEASLREDHWKVPVVSLEDFLDLFGQLDNENRGDIECATLQRFFRQAASEPETADLARAFGAKERLTRADFAAMWHQLAETAPNHI